MRMITIWVILLFFILSFYIEKRQMKRFDIANLAGPDFENLSLGIIAGTMKLN